MQRPGNQITEAPGSESLIGTVMVLRMFDDIAPIPAAGATPHAARLTKRTRVTGHNIASEDG